LTPFVTERPEEIFSETPIPEASPTEPKISDWLEIPCWQIPAPAPYQNIQEGWTRYLNADYCFTLTYPANWTLIASRNAIALTEDTIALVIGFRKTAENIVIQRTGVGAGEIETVGTVQFLGQEVSREVLVYDKKVKAILYNYGTEISINGLVFTISGDDFSPDYDTASLSDEILAVFDEIVKSIYLIK
jgi:hypothetical protein